MNGTPAPLVPAEVDLRDFAFMPLDVVRLRDSGLTAKASGDEFRAAVLLWCASWHQVPAASLPDDDDELANICGYSRSRREWAKVREGARRGWLACSDGRLYHQAVAGKALEAWIEKLASAIGGAVGNAKRWNVAIDTGRLRVQFCEAVDALRALDPQSRTLKKKAVAVLTAPSPPDSPPDTPPDSPPDSHPDRKGQGQGQGLFKDSTSAEPTGLPGFGEGTDKAQARPSIPCPYDAIVALYHAALPSLPRVRLMPATRQRAMRKVWGWVLSSTKGDGTRRAETADQALAWLRAYFARASENDFLMGRSGRSAEHANWTPDLDFLLTDRGMKHVIEKTQEAA